METNIMEYNNNNNNNNSNNNMAEAAEETIVLRAGGKPRVDMEMFRTLFPVPQRGSKEGFDSEGLYWYRTYTDMMEPVIQRASVLALRPASLGCGLFPGDICVVLVRTKHGPDRMLGRVYPKQEGGVTVTSERSRGYGSYVSGDCIGGILKVIFAGREIGA